MNSGKKIYTRLCNTYSECRYISLYTPYTRPIFDLSAHLIFSSFQFYFYFISDSSRFLFSVCSYTMNSIICIIIRIISNQWIGRAEKKRISLSCVCVCVNRYVVIN